eukprot:5818738-Pyramimonas_sp.AAC.1
MAVERRALPQEIGFGFVLVSCGRGEAAWARERNDAAVAKVVDATTMDALTIRSLKFKCV